MYSLASIHNKVDVDCEYTLLNPNPHFKTVGSAIITTNVTLDREKQSYHKVRLELNNLLVLSYSTKIKYSMSYYIKLTLLFKFIRDTICSTS